MPDYKIFDKKKKFTDRYKRRFVERNKKIMDLENPMLDEDEKNFILKCVKTAPFKLNIPPFIKMYHEDGLGRILPDIDFWLRNNWAIIDRYNKTIKYDVISN